MDTAADNAGFWQQALQARYVGPVLLLAAFWCWETWRPFFGFRHDRMGHAARNLALAALNTAVLALLFGSTAVAVAQWAAGHGLGLVPWLEQHVFEMRGFWPRPGILAIPFVLAL